METIGISKLRENLLQYVKKAQEGEIITITSRGREVAKLGPLEDRMEEARKRLRELRKTAVLGDIVSPVGETWEAMK